RPARPIAPPEALEALAEAEMTVGGHRIDLDEATEGLRGALVVAAVVVGPSERFHDRSAARLEPARSLEHDRRLCMVALAQQLVPALEQRVCPLALIGRLRLGRLGHARHGATPSPPALAARPLDVCAAPARTARFACGASPAQPPAARPPARQRGRCPASKRASPGR